MVFHCCLFRSHHPSIHPRFQSSATRADHRTAFETRDYRISPGFLSNNGTDGSAMVLSDQGGTMVIAAVTCQIGQTTAMGMGGDVLVHVSHPGLDQVETTGALQAVLQRIAMASVDVERLTLLSDDDNDQNNKFALRLDIAVRILDADGNVLDVAVAALTAALVDTVIPTFLYDETDGRYYRTIAASGGGTEPPPQRRVPLKAHACALSAVGYRDEKNDPKHMTWWVDPTREERALGCNVVTVVVDAYTGGVVALELAPTTRNDNGAETAAAVSPADLHQVVEMARQHAQHLWPLLLQPAASSPDE
jgi:exosome complex RNA-binding protein Rrp42 (RNase PH superfamily)